MEAALARLWCRQEEGATQARKVHVLPRIELQGEASQDGLFDCYFRALRSLIRQMLNTRV